MTKLCPVILSGGSGTRLWPLSRELHPKQFIPFDGDTLFGKTLERAASLPAAAPLVVCNERHRFFASGIVREKGLSATVILEPAPRNTAPAIAIAALAALEDGEDGEDPALLILPSDHSLSPQEIFAEAVSVGLSGAAAGCLVTFGILPSRPETGYGYIRRGDALPWGGNGVARFVEKPDRATAETLLATGGHLWNSGIFLFTASALLEELGRFAPEMKAAVEKTWATRRRDGAFLRFDEETFAAIPSESIDYAVMEKTARAAVVELPVRWNDLGSWSAFYDEAPHDDKGNASVGDVVLKDAKNCYVHSSHRLVAAMDLEGVAVVETADAVLVMDRDKTQGVKELLASLKREGRPETSTHLTVYRPWGSYQTLAASERFQVKRIIVNPGGALSSQYHHHRAEHWIVVRGTARITNGDKTFLLGEDQSSYIPLGVVHRLVNPGIVPLELIEVQSGGYLGEDDIVRLEDSYGRV
ncbi:MAG: mannose-1-phosphate guanylyltransferase/mannose-6-phosphate isomerase [Deltaproteobacteria bacterium]|jgi:mannose-1-phosphate guanylyltransferase/mannose-6-phosphate isomerase|nr:mannose-1-phosphate guanylyltransferase/mannose-6-phosphate isomerase [Deltaproteobacteria bacterium]